MEIIAEAEQVIAQAERIDRSNVPAITYGTAASQRRDR